ncbi:DMT family transporter [Brevibacillus marinus]|uniref:DMT family transporter n=1 Tax=Brevibacillus marinus TaxID=2496837 RepID=UPI000F847D9C|nr:multidrug efflux SMR transporter [Brevibacillus marinus]
MKPFLLLLLAIATEVTGTTALKMSEGFSRLWPSLFVVVSYAASFYILSLALKYLPLGIAYAIWSGLGTAATVAIGVWLWNESLTAARVIGILLIIAGTVVLQLFKSPA